MEKKRTRELKKLLEAVENELSWKPLKPKALDKVKAYLRGVEKPKKETLDKISLFVGFQDWDSFRCALDGDDDGETVVGYSCDDKLSDLRKPKGKPAGRRSDDTGIDKQKSEKADLS